MVVITAIRPHRRDARQVEVVIDDRRRMTLPADVAADLRAGMALDVQAAEALEARAEETKALAKVGRMLARRPHAVAEVRTRLRASGFSRPVIEGVVGQLEASGDLDDTAFARAWVENRGAFRPRSAAMIRSELLRKGVTSQPIEAALAEFDETEAAEAALRRVARRWKELEAEARRRRLYDYLARRGFSHETIRSVLRTTARVATGRESEGKS